MKHRIILEVELAVEREAALVLAAIKTAVEDEVFMIILGDELDLEDTGEYKVEVTLDRGRS